MGYADPPAKNLFLLFPAASAQARLHSARRQGTTASDYRKGKIGGAFGSAAGVVTAGLRVVDRIVEPLGSGVRRLVGVAAGECERRDREKDQDPQRDIP